MKFHTSVCSDPPTASFPWEFIAAQRSPKHMAEIKYTICFATHETQNSCLWTRDKTPLPPPPPSPPPLCLSLNFYIPGKCCEHWIVTLIATGIISQRKPMDKRDGNEVDRHWCSAFRWRNTGEDCASILIALYLTLAFNNKRQMLNLERRESPLKGQKFCLTDETL